jgi:hypothetical protein
LRCLVLVGCVVDFSGGGSFLWLILRLGHFLFGLKEDRTIPCPMICTSLLIHAIQRSILDSTPASPSVHVVASRVVIISFGVESLVPALQMQRSKIFLPVLWWPTSI